MAESIEGKIRVLLTTRSPCDTTFHSIKEVKVLLPSVWFTREKEREKVVMLLRYSERHGEETGQQNSMLWRLSNQTNILLSTDQPLRSALVGRNDRRTCFPGGSNLVLPPPVPQGWREPSRPRLRPVSEKRKIYQVCVWTTSVLGGTILKEVRHREETQWVKKLSSILHSSFFWETKAFL